MASEPYDIGDTVVALGDNFTFKGKIASIYGDGDFDVNVGVQDGYYTRVTVDPDVHVVSKVEPERTIKPGDVLSRGTDTRVVVEAVLFGDIVAGRCIYPDGTGRELNQFSIDGWLDSLDYKIVGNVFDLADAQ